MDRNAFVDYLNALANEIPSDAFHRTGVLNRVTYVTRYVGDGEFSYRNRIITKGRVLYVGRGHSGRATEHLRNRGKVTGPTGRDFDAFIADEWPLFEAFSAASVINESVSAEFEHILYREFNPPFNAGPPTRVYAALGDADTSVDMQLAKFIPYQFSKLPPPHTHISIWDEVNQNIPDDAILTRVSERRKGNKDQKAQKHYDSYPPRGQSTCFADHREKNAHLSLQQILGHVWWDATYPDDPIIEITWPSGAGDPPEVVHPVDGPVFIVGDE